MQEAATVSRPINTHTATAPIRQHNQRNHSHSISLGAVNANHRVTRRKSMSSTAANAAAVIAASLKDSSEPNGLPMIGSHRRALSSRKGQESTSIGSGSAFGSYLSRSVNAASPDSTTSGRKHSPTVVDENQPGLEETKPISTKNRNRRASEGAPLMRGEGKRVSTEVRCDQCGKGYKHSSCLTKHMCVYPSLPSTVLCYWKELGEGREVLNKKKKKKKKRLVESLPGLLLLPVCVRGSSWFLPA